MSRRPTFTLLALPAVLAVLAPVVIMGCQSKPIGHPSRTGSGVTGPDAHTRRDLELTADQEATLAALASAADEHPEDFAARKASGLAHMDFTLAGVLHLRDRAERDLEAAFDLDPTDAELSRSLARFYNLRAVAGDYSKAEQQVRVYAALLGDQRPEAMTDSDFVAYSFFMLGQVLTAKNRGSNLAALRLVETLEDQLAARVRSHPDDIELRALTGNFAFFFAGNIPLERERRVRDAVASFELVRARWDELRVGARDPLHCPNTRENFMFELAEGLMVLEREAEAREIYAELVEITAPQTRAKELIAYVAGERLRNLDSYVGDMRLMPPWPSDVGNCVVCHAWSSDVPLDSLYSIEPIRLSDVPSKATPKPILAGRQVPVGITDRLARECAPCHFAGGEVVDALDLSDPTQVVRQGLVIDARVQAGEMPPGQPLGDAARAELHAWAMGLLE